MRRLPISSSMLFSLAMLLSFMSLSAFAQNSSALINQQLDKIQNLNLNGELPQVMKAIEEATAVPIRVPQNVYDLLPWGEQTNITAKIENKTLRQGLEAITQKLGLRFELRDESIELQPVPALARLGRRSSVDELAALDLLASTPMGLTTEQTTLKDLIAAVDDKLVELKSPFAIENRTHKVDNVSHPIFVQRNATMSDALESIAIHTGATWYPWGKTILIVEKEDQVRNLLSKTITTRYNRVDISQVLSELSRTSGVTFAIEPGAIQRIPAEFRNVTLVLDNASIQQTLENIAGFTGLGYVVNPEGVYVWNQSATPTGGGGPKDPIVGIIQLDDLGIQILLPTSQVPADLREFIKSKTQKKLEEFRQRMEEEGFKPTPPTTQPTAKEGQDL